MATPTRQAALGAVRKVAVQIVGRIDPAEGLRVVGEVGHGFVFGFDLWLSVQKRGILRRTFGDGPFIEHVPFHDIQLGQLRGFIRVRAGQL
jgi:hypothetical protein